MVMKPTQKAMQLMSKGGNMIDLVMFREGYLVLAVESR